MSGPVQFEEESFKPGNRQFVADTTTDSSLVRFLIRHHIVKTKKVAMILLFVLVGLLFLASAVFIILGEMQIQIHAPTFQSNLVQTAPAP